MALSSKYIDNTQQLLKDQYIRRLVNDSSVALGDLYDIRLEQIVGKLLFDKKAMITVSQQKVPECLIMKSDTCFSEDTYRIIGIQDEPWLNSVLNIVPPRNMNAFIHYLPDTTANSCCLYFYHCSHEQAFSPVKTVVAENIPKTMPTVDATHVISTVKLGVQALIVLHLPSDDNGDQLDRLLDSTREQLIKHKYESSSGKKTLLDRITVAKIFSNIPNLNQKSTFTDLCQRISNISANKHCHHPIEFTLRTIQYFYPFYPAEQMIYSPLSRYNISLLKQYLISLSLKIKNLEIMLNSKEKLVTKQCFKEQYQTFQERLTDVKKMHSAELEHIRNLLTEVRAGKIPQNSIREMLFNQSQQSCQDVVNSLLEDIRVLGDKEEHSKTCNNEDNNEHSRKDTDSIKPNESPNATILLTNNELNNSGDGEEQSTALSLSNVEPKITDISDSENNKSCSNASTTLEDPIERDSSSDAEKTVISDQTLPEPIDQTNTTNDQYRKTELLLTPSPPSEPKSSASRPNSRRSTVFSVPSEPQQLNTNEKASVSSQPQSKSSIDLGELTKNQLDTNDTTNGEHKSSEESVSNHSSTLPSISDNNKELVNSSVSLNKSDENVHNEDSTEQSNPMAKPLKGEKDNESTSQSDALKSQITVSSEQARNSSQALQPEEIIPAEQQRNDEDVKSDGRTSEELPKDEIQSESSPLPDINYINVLLLGESGVGKSTFINALANYYTFSTFEDACSSKPFVVLPVSFLMTTGDTFEEQTVQFGDIDPNEEHGHPGQSVTQHCRSYVFSINAENKLRLIDTPGMGDTRGLEQDDLNMQHILLYINNLSHLNAICILLKPNESRLTIVLRSYFTRLLNFVGENARDNIVFCFTNARSTFYAPGNTGPLLRKMINDLPTKGIKFERTNTFCFDSEAFRYLIAVKNGINFDSHQHMEYQQSWTKSSEVANSLIQYICSELQPHSQSQWQSLENVEFQTKQLIRPLLETTRNTLRNAFLIKQNSSEVIKLNPEAISQAATICYTCLRQAELFASIWIYPDTLHIFTDQCDNCECNGSKHIAVDYKLQYKPIAYDNILTLTQTNENFNKLRMNILKCAQFYGYLVGILKQNDPLLPAFKRIVAEENVICSQNGTDCPNSLIRDQLTSLMNDYVEEKTKMISNGIPVNLSNFIEVIESIYENEELNEQIKAIKKTQENYIKQHEKEVSLITDHINHQ